MLIPIHADITRKALEKTFDPKVLEIVIRANKNQDAIKGQIGHPEYHFDNNKISESQRYLQKQRDSVVILICQMALRSAWVAFGRLLHTAQDFYAHTNYIALWLDQFEGGICPSADEVNPLDELTLSNPQLRSGRLYYPLELLSFIPVIRKTVIPLLPRDSHAWMNLDSPASGEKFPYAFSAAVKRTIAELEYIKGILALEDYDRFING
jgi:hypothetical protein